MGVRCSLFGCNYGDSEIEREREERGSEVVMTVREYETCSRCGNTRIISENTGVTALAPEPEDDENASDPWSDEDNALEGTTDPEPVDPDGTERSPEETRIDDGAPEIEENSAEIIESTEAGGEDTPVPSENDSAGQGTGGTDTTDGESVAPEDLDAIDPDESAQILKEGDDADGGDGTEPAARATRSEADPGDEDTTSADREEPASASAPDDDAEILDETAEGSIDSHTETEVDYEPWPESDDQLTTTETSAQERARTDRTDPDGASDDAVIIGESEFKSGSEREHGAWPEVGSEQPREPVEDSDHGSWPEHDREDQGWDATVGEADAGSRTEVVEIASEADSDTAQTRSTAVAANTGDQADLGAGTTGVTASKALTCSTCTYVVADGQSPHVAGDICPECTRGYLTE